MRLIDADALVDQIKLEAEADTDKSIQTTLARTLTLLVCKAIIEKQPTIEPQRKTGKWIPVMNGRGGHCCDRCNGYAPSYMNGDEHLSDFCPNCGAKMEGKE